MSEAQALAGAGLARAGAMSEAGALADAGLARDGAMSEAGSNDEGGAGAGAMTGWDVVGVVIAGWPGPPAHF